MRTHVRALGFSPERLPWTTFQGTPMRHRGVHVGSFFLVEKEGGAAFTEEDEEVLVMFAAQAATAIANARTYRAEQQARADLAALVETSPVGVVVFDAATGRAVSLNREARRIVESLCLPGQTAEHLIEVMTVRRADGREIALDRFPLAGELIGAETVRAEEIEFSVPGGRSVSTLINATPIQDADGAVSSLVVTMQDLAPIEELERQRSEFLGLVSHELRAPLTSIKGSAATALGASRELDPAEVRQFFRIIDGQADRMDALISDLLDAGRIDAGTLSVSPEPEALAGLLEQARSTFLSGGGRHTLRMDLPADLPPVMADSRRIVQVLNNLFSNAARHSPDSSPIRVAAARDGVHVAVSVSDDGRGIPPDLLPPGVPEARRGRGRRARARGRADTAWAWPSARGWSRAHGGRIWAESGGAGQGSRFTFTLPVAAEAGEDGAAAARRGSGVSRPGTRRRASSSWTTTRRRCATYATRWPRPATPR